MFAVARENAVSPLSKHLRDWSWDRRDDDAWDHRDVSLPSRLGSVGSEARGTGFAN